MQQHQAAGQTKKVVVVVCPSTNNITDAVRCGWPITSVGVVFVAVATKGRRPQINPWSELCGRRAWLHTPAQDCEYKVVSLAATYLATDGSK